MVLDWKRTFATILFALCLLTFSACAADNNRAGNGQPSDEQPSVEHTNQEPGQPDTEAPGNAESPANSETPEKSAESDALDPISALIESMTPSEKIGQLVMIGVEGESMDESITAYIEERHIGGVILYGRNLQSTEQSQDLINALKETNRSGDIPLFIGVDEEGGLVTRLPSEVLPTPSSRDIGSYRSPQLASDIGELIGRKVSGFGFNMNFAPVLDIDSNPDNPVIGDRSFGSDAETVGSLGVELMTGMKAQQVIPVIKHFPGHGDTDTDSHVELPIVLHDEARLRSFELQPFIDAIENGADAVMIAHLLVPAFDDQYPASMSKPIITDLLREELGFDGVVVTDDMTMGAIQAHYDFEQSVLRSVQAGSDLILVGHGYDLAERAIRALEQAFLTGELSESRIDESLRRILRLKNEYELSDEPVDPVDIDQMNEDTKDVLSSMDRYS